MLSHGKKLSKTLSKNLQERVDLSLGVLMGWLAYNFIIHIKYKFILYNKYFISDCKGM